MTGRMFLLARSPPLHTTLIDEATGLAAYKVDSPQKVSQPVTKVRKLDPPIQPPLHWIDEGEDDYSSDDVVTQGGDLPETSDEMARIYWKSDRIVFRGRITTQKEFLPATGKLRGSFAFTGPDGVQYRWAMGSMGMDYPKLVTADERKTVIAEFHRAHHFTKKRKARLEVQPVGMHMLDYIVLTFVFVENMRKERNKGVNSAANYA